MSSKTPFLFLLLAMLGVVILSTGGDDPESSEPASSQVGAQEPDLHARPGTHHGIEWSSWGREAAEAKAAAESQPPAEKPARPSTYIVEDDAHSRIPQAVRERLARDYPGLDIAVARPAPDTEPGARR